LGFQNRRTASGSARLMWGKNTGPFRFEIHSRLSFSQGDDVAFSAFFPVPLPATLFDLTTSWLSNTNTSVTNTIDRLSVTYSTNNMVLKIGRQAITWGSGMVFHPGDIVAPFAPNALDTAYKPGADMIYGQVLFDSGADIQLIAVPRGAVLNGPILFSASTYALRGQFQLASLDASLMLARDRGDSVASVGLSGALGGASWNAEYVGWRLADGTAYPSYLFNISNFSTLGTLNISYFGEYFHNGFGVAAAVPLDALPASLSKRMSTGQVFLPGMDFLALGAALQVTPDLSVSPSALLSLDDRSALASLGVNYTLGDNTNFVVNYSQPFGPVGSEFGGRETSAGSGVYGMPPRSLSLQLVHFF
ncbi:MAG: hypothetical protein GXP03_06885, partial [Alphaproteobacteria bacterium]|nr:hypothetical protein [Alphaproteobacteria bacterium]